MSVTSKVGWLWVAKRTTARRGSHPGNPSHPGAFTLIEMLIAMALTLILVYAIAEFYAYVGNTVKDGRAMIEMNGQMRIATARLKADLELLTVPVVPWADDGSAPGYFEILEGPACDADVNANNILDGSPLEDSDANGVNDFQQANVTSTSGDTDDILAFTIRSNGAPFTGRACVPNSDPPSYFNISSQTAEVVWFTGFDDKDGDNLWDAGEPTFLYRRVLLIVPTVTAGVPVGATNVDYFKYNDVSAHLTSAAGYQPNSLIDLSRRENRFGHQGLASSFPNPWILNPRDYTGFAQAVFSLTNERVGEDRILSNLLAFDVRVFDPTAQVRADGDTTGATAVTTDDAIGTLQPGDPGFLEVMKNNSTYPTVGYGAYVDLGYWHQLYDQLVADGMAAATATTTLNTALGNPSPSSFDFQGSYLPLIGRTYDTWALSYERDGTNQDGDAVTDEGTDGLDNDGVNGVDDPGERETSPPYPVPLRGIQVQIRLYEPATRQVRQATVGADFIQE